jgi:hypothetical protein
MHGNVEEWCADWSDFASYTDALAVDPQGPSTSRYRSLRGGSWGSGRDSLRCASRGENLPSTGRKYDGFRVVMAATNADATETPPQPETAPNPPVSIAAEEDKPTSGVVLVPSDLRLGDTYHLAFVTSKTLSARSADASTYNKFVQSLADDAGIGNSLGLTWHAVASTSTIDARDNAPITGPVYDLRGYRLADGASDMWDNFLPIPFNIDEHGEQVIRESVYTGTKPPGVAEPGFELGNSGGRSRMGNTGLPQRWLLYNWSNPSVSHRFYGISAQLVIPSGSRETIQSSPKKRQGRK